MREMKPLMLPKLVAARKPSKSSLDMSAEPTSSVYSSTDSGFYSASECSTPPTPSFYLPRGHLRHPSSTSSLSSSPPNCTYDPIEGPNASGKLPKLTEEPIEREDDYVTVHAPRFSCMTGLAPALLFIYAYADQWQATTTLISTLPHAPQPSDLTTTTRRL